MTLTRFRSFDGAVLAVLVCVAAFQLYRGHETDAALWTAIAATRLGVILLDGVDSAHRWRSLGIAVGFVGIAAALALFWLRG